MPTAADNAENARIRIGSQKYADRQAANKAAEDIMNAGSVSYVDASGSTVNVEVGDVTVTGADQ